MRADSYSQNLFCTLFCTRGSAVAMAMLLLLTIFLSGCKTDKDSAPPSIIGVPPEDAYLGVEYSYNFGAIDDDDILDYSLTNAPTWLALEDTTNKARQGIIMRGVPGISGGQRGRKDLGETTRINLVANDRATSGAQPFNIDVQENQLSVASNDYSESGRQEQAPGQNEDTEKPEFQCAKPFTGGTGKHSYPIKLYSESGDFEGVENKTSTTRPVLVQVNLDQPSVTRIDVAFELRSSFDPSQCDQGFSAPHQRCDTGLSNSDDAIIGRDIVGWGAGSDETLPVPDYVVYQKDENGDFTKGLLTLEPGITECYVRLEVVDDLEPERVEAFTFALTEIRSGIAGLGSSNTGIREPLRIEDNEPTATVETRLGGKRDVVNPGTETEYLAILEGERDKVYYAKISAQEGSDSIQGTHFILQTEKPSGSGNWEDGDLIEFPVGNDKVVFRLATQDSGSYNNPLENDRFTLLGVNSQYQAGRSNHAASKKDDELRVSINELTSVLQVGTENGFVPTDMTISQNGRAFIAGYDSASGNNNPIVRVFNQKGVLVSERQLYPRGISLDAPPVIVAISRDVEVGDEDVLRHEFAVAFGVEEDNAGNPTPENVNIVTQLWFYDSALTPENYVKEWQFINGSDEDDLPRWIGLEPTSGYVLVSGVTRGVFKTDDTANDYLGSFVQRIDTEQDGALRTPELAWVRKVESTSHDERVVGGGIQNNLPIVIGDSKGAVEGESQFGGKDAFFYKAQPENEEIEVQQVGTDSDENLVDGFYSGARVWLIGNGNGDYTIKTEEGVKVLRRSFTNSPAGFLLGYTPAGSALEAYLVNDDDDQSAETLRVAMMFNDDLVAAGSTTGVLGGDPAADTNTLEDPAIFRRNRQPRFEEDEDEDTENNNAEDKTLIVEPSQEWSQQIPIADPGTGVVEALANYRDDEITALVKRNGTGGAVWTLNLFSAEGDPLNGP